MYSSFSTASLVFAEQISMTSERKFFFSFWSQSGCWWTVEHSPELFFINGVKAGGAEDDATNEIGDEGADGTGDDEGRFLTSSSKLSSKISNPLPVPPEEILALILCARSS